MPTPSSRATSGSGRFSRSQLVAAAVVLPVIVLTGCTSVTRTTLVQAGPSAGPADGSTGLVDGGTQGGTSGGSAATSTSGGLIGGGSSTSGAGSTGAGTSGGAAGVATTGGAGTSGGPAASTCKTPVKIGVSHSSDNGKAAGAFGAAGGIDKDALDAYDNANKQGNTTMVSWVNANGGFAGCPGVVSFYDFKMLAADGPAAETQRECTAFGQDQKVNIVYSNMSETGGLIPCLAKKGIVTFFDGIGYAPSPADFKKYQGLLYQSRAITPYRWGPFITLLSRYGYLAADAQGNKTSSPAVGILLADRGDGHNQYLVNKLWVPALNKLGAKSVVYTFSATGDPSAAFNSAVVQFKRNNVTHVLMTPDAGAATVLFTQTAEAQQFRPRYGLTTVNSAPSFAVLTQQGQRNNSMLVSIDPYMDVAANDVANGGSLAQFNSNGRSANAALCDQIFKGRIPARSAMITMYPICDRYLELRAALARQTSFSKQNLLAGMNAVTHAPAVGYGNRSFSAPNHYDGYPAVRVAQWQESNRSFIYKSPKLPIPRFEG